MFKHKLNSYLGKILSSNIGRRMASGAFWTFTGTAISKFIVLIAGIFCARFLSSEEYGEFGLVRSTINMFVVLGSAGLGLTATKYISEYLGSNKTKISQVYILTNGFAVFAALALTISIILLSPYLSRVTLNAPHLDVSIKIGALLLFVAIINAAQNGTLAGFEDFKSIAINTLVGGVAESVLMLLGAYFYNVNGAICGYGAGFAILYVCNKISIKKLLRRHDIRITRTSCLNLDYSIIIKFTLPAALSSIICVPVFWIIRTMLVRNSNFSELALYEVSDQWKTIVLFIPTAISRIVLPILSSISSDNNKKKAFWKILKANILVNSSVSILLTVLVCMFGNHIIHFYGSEYNNVYPLIFLSISTIFTSIANVVGQAISSKAKMWVGFFFNALWSLMTITFSVVFLNMGLGATALSLSLLISYFIHSILQLLYLKCIIK